MKKKVAPKKKNIITIPDLFSVKVVMAGKEYQASGETIHEALEKLNLSQFKGKGVITVSGNGKEKTIILQPTLLRKLVQPSQRLFLEKRLQILLS